MNTIYCEEVERKIEEQSRLVSKVIIKDINSPLVSLKESDQKFIFEPSSDPNYQYLVRREVFQKLEDINEILKSQDKILVIRSVWRSAQHQKLIWDNKFEELRKKHPKKTIKEIEEMVAVFIAPPDESMHLTGGAVDALIYDLRTKSILDFGTNNGYKITLNKKCYPFHPDITPLAQKNRKLLITLFEKRDFVCDLTEYWHFDYGNAVWAVEKKRKYAIYGPVKDLDPLKS